MSEDGGQRPINAMIAGAQKAGTSSLKAYMAQHPDICTHPRPELSYFVDDPDYLLGYESNFRRNFAGCPPEALLIGKSATAMTQPEYVGRMHASNPAMKIIVILRNPVERAYSAYWWARRTGLEDQPTFEEALRAEPEWADNLVKMRSRAYVSAGEYARQLAELFERFGRDQVQVLLFDDLRADAASVCRDVFAFVGVRPFAPDVRRKRNRASRARSLRLARVLAAQHPMKRALRQMLPSRMGDGLRTLAERWNAVDVQQPAMREDTRRALLAHFAPHNEALELLIDRDLTVWGAPPPVDLFDQV